MPNDTSSSSSDSTASGRTYLDADPRRRADSVINADPMAPQKNDSHRKPNSRKSIFWPSATDLPSDVVLPVMCDTNVPQTIKITTLVYPATQDSEMASRDFWRNE